MWGIFLVPGHWLDFVITLPYHLFADNSFIQDTNRILGSIPLDKGEYISIVKEGKTIHEVISFSHPGKLIHVNAEPSNGIPYVTKRGIGML